MYIVPMQFNENLYTKELLTEKNHSLGFRKLKASWTPEMAQDLNAFYAINAEEELVALLNDALPFLYKRFLLVEKYIPPKPLDVTEELTALLSEELAKQIDKQIMESLLAIPNEGMENDC